MEKDDIDGLALSHLQQQRTRSTSSENVDGRWWMFVLLGVVLIVCSSIPVVSSSSSSSHEQDASKSSSSTIPFLAISRSPSSAVSTNKGSRYSILKRRQLLVAQEGGGDYESVPLIEKAVKDAPPGSAEKIIAEGAENVRDEKNGQGEAENHVLHNDVANADEDYENVALMRGGYKESEADARAELERQRTESANEDTGGTKVALDEQSNLEGEHTGVEKLLDRLEESVGNEEDGRFNKTISEQDGVLETVARVGGHFDEDEDEEESTDTEKEVLQMIDTELLGLKPKEENNSMDDGGLAENSKDQAETDVTWLDRIMGQSDQPHRLEPAVPLMTNKSRDPSKNHSSAAQKKNSTREKAVKDNVGGFHQADDVPRLIDREDNEYVISNPGKNRMMLQEDLTLISDIVMVIVAAALGGTICGLLGQPVILGYLAAGIVVGPGGLHLVHEIVQVETLAQFGVVFLLFVLGVEFNPSKMQGIHNVTLGGGCLQIGTTMLLGGICGGTIPQGVFIGAFLSMSSTAVVVKCLMDSKMGGTEHGQIMLGTLILQDCALGLLLAVMPALGAKDSDAETFAFALLRAAVLLFVFCGSAWLLAKTVIPRFLRALVQLTKFNSELFLLGAIGICLSFALISESLGLSLEVGAFVGGLVLSGGTHTERTLHQVEPIRNVFAALFLSSIGMVMHPAFLWEHIDILMASLAVVFLGKTCLFAAVVRAFGYSNRTSVSVGVALAQIGEFAFILLSRAQGLGLVSKKLYLLLMGTSALSLVLTPFAFKIVVRLNPPGQTVIRKLTSKPIHTPVDFNSQSYPGAATGTPDGDDTPLSEDVFPTDLTALDEHVESIDMEDGRGDHSSPARVTLRRPYNQGGLGGKWNEWRNELKESGFFEQRK